MRVLVTGGTGFIGAALCHALTGAGHAVTVVTRDPARVDGPAIGWERVSAAVRETDALVNLAGEPLGSQRWSVRQKELVRQSRVLATRTLVDAVAAAEPRPKGPVSGTGPKPGTMRDFARMLGRTLARPAWRPTPAFALRLALGEMAELLLTGQRVLPGVASRFGYPWRYPELGGALRASVRRR